MSARWLAVLAASGASCISASEVPCGERICPATLVCSIDQTCVSPGQLAACTSVGSGEACTADGTAGFCHDGACVSSLGVCGDGAADLTLGELCDCGTPDILAAPPAGCTGFNSNDPGATCRADCKPAGCGDDVVDPGELCDDGNSMSGDGCRADCQGRFAKQQTPTAENLIAVSASDDHHACAVGTSGSALLFDGMRWTAVIADPTPLAELHAVWSSSGSDVYAGGSDGLFHYDGSTWAAAAGIPSGTNITGLWGADAGDVYAIGRVLYHATNGTFIEDSLPSECVVEVNNLTSIHGVWGRSGSDVYVAVSSVVLSDGRGLNAICHWDGSAWSLQNGEALGSVSMMSGDDRDLYAMIDQSNIARYSGPAPPTVIAVPGFLSSFAVTGPGELIGIGDSGVLLRLDLATGAWSHLVAPTELPLSAISSTGPRNVFIVGNSGTVLH